MIAFALILLLVVALGALKLVVIKIAEDGDDVDIVGVVVSRLLFVSLFTDGVDMSVVGAAELVGLLFAGRLPVARGFLSFGGVVCWGSGKGCGIAWAFIIESR